MRLKVQLFGQRNEEWKDTFLGYNDRLPYNISNYGCLITSLGMYLNKTPLEINKTLIDNNGYTNGGLFVWSKCTVLGLNQTYVSPHYMGPVTPQGISKIKECIDQRLPLLCEVDFNPATPQEEMHFVLIIGYTDETIIYADPWTGTINDWNYDAAKRSILQFRTYDKKLTTEDGTTTISVDSKVFEELVRKSTITDEISKKLGVSPQKDVLLGEIDKFLGYEDAIREKEKQNEELREQLRLVTEQAESDRNMLKNLEKNMEENRKKDLEMIDSLKIKYSDVFEQLQGLKKASEKDSRSGLDDIIIGISKLLRIRR